MDLPPELIVLGPLALAAGIDLYLTLLFLGAAPTTPWWDHPMPGALGDLDSPGILIVMGVFYLLEFAAERYRPSALVWNAFHAVIRPVAGALIALMVLEGQPLSIVISGAALAAAISSFAHAARSGAAILHWLGPGDTPHVLLVSVLEDVVVLGVVALALDRPVWAAGACAGMVVVALPGTPSRLRAFAFAIRLAAGRTFQTLVHRRWLGVDELPGWVRSASKVEAYAPTGALRGSPAGAFRLPGAARFSTGWAVVTASGPVFVFRRHAYVDLVDLARLETRGVEDTGYFRRVDLVREEGGTACIFFSVNGPPEESLRAEFLFHPARA